MVNLRDAIYDTIRRELSTLLRIEVGQVERVHWHKTDGDLDFNVVDVRIRDYKYDISGSKELIRIRVPVLQREGGRWQGTPWTPKIGDLVLVLFYQNEKAVVLGTLPNWEQPPLCRPGPRGFDDDVKKLAQWQQPGKDGIGQYVEFKPPKKPYCEKWWGKDRSRIFVLECPLGDEDPSCQKCDDISKITDYSKSIRIYSSEHPERPDFIRIDHVSGAYIEFNTKGTIDIKSELPPEQGARARVVAEDDSSVSDEHGEIAAEITYVPNKATVRIYKDGCIRARSGNDGSEVFLDTSGRCWMWNLKDDTWIEFDGSECEIKAPTIRLVGDLVVTGSGTVAGSFTHGDGPCCNIGDGWV